MKKIYLMILIESILFCLFAYIVFYHPVLTIDQIVYHWIANHIMNDTITKIMKFITFFGSFTGVILVNILLYLLMHDHKTPLLASMNLATCYLCYQTIKKIIHRSRPPWLHLVNETGFSFPSGHTSISMALYGMLIIQLYHSTYRYKFLVISLLACLIFLVGFSRIYLGVHFLSDIIGAFLLGMIFLQIENLVISHLNESKL